MQIMRQALAFSMVISLGFSALWTAFGSDPKPLAWAIVYAAIVVFILVLTMDADDYTGENNG